MSRDYSCVGAAPVNVSHHYSELRGLLLEAPVIVRRFGYERRVSMDISIACKYKCIVLLAALCGERNIVETSYMYRPGN